MSNLKVGDWVRFELNDIRVAGLHWFGRIQQLADNGLIVLIDTSKYRHFAQPLPFYTRSVNEVEKISDNLTKEQAMILILENSN